MFEVADRFYNQLVPQARTLTARAEQRGRNVQAWSARATIDEILARPEHRWRVEGAPVTADSG